MVFYLTVQEVPSASLSVPSVLNGLGRASCFRCSTLRFSDCYGVSSQAGASRNHSRAGRRANVPKVFIEQSEFNQVAEVVRELLKLDKQFPVMPFARAERLEITVGKRIKTDAYAQREENSQLILKTERAEDKLLRSLSDFKPIRCKLHNSAETPYTELYVCAAGRVEAMDEQIINFYKEFVAEPQDNQLRYRCPLCKRFTFYEPYVNWPFAITSQSDIFRLNDFNGIYVSTKGKELLEPYFGELVDFVPATLSA